METDVFLIFSGTRILAIDDNLREKANECIQTNFTAVIETREFQMLPMIKLELIGLNQKQHLYCSLYLIIYKIRFESCQVKSNM